MLRSIVDKNRFMTLATADEEGIPWATPVWYATADHREFIWVSAPQARHSQNVTRREVGIVFFDSHQTPGTGEAVYLSALAEEVRDSELDRCIDIFSTVSREQGLPTWHRTDVEPPARLRLYRATATAHFILTSGDERLAVELR